MHADLVRSLCFSHGMVRGRSLTGARGTCGAWRVGRHLGRHRRVSPSSCCDGCMYCNTTRDTVVTLHCAPYTVPSLQSAPSTGQAPQGHDLSAMARRSMLVYGPACPVARASSRVRGRGSLAADVAFLHDASASRAPGGGAPQMTLVKFLKIVNGKKAHVISRCNGVGGPPSGCSIVHSLTRDVTCTGQGP